MQQCVVGVDRSHRAEQLHLLVPDHLGLKVGRCLHADDRDELHDVVLHDVAERAGTFVIRAAPLDADLLGHGDLHVVDVLPVPQRFEDAVRKTEYQEVLDSFLAEVVIDAIDLLFNESGVQPLVELARCGEVTSEWLLDDHANEGAGRLRRQAGGIEPVRQRHHGVWRRAEIEKTVATGAALAIDGFEHVAEWLESVSRVVVVGDVAQAFGERVPGVITQRHAAVLLDALTHLRAKLVVGHLAPAGAHHCESRRQVSFRGQRVERRHELAFRQVAAGAEDDDAEGNRRPRLTAALLQWSIRRQCDGDAPGADSAFTGWPPNSLRNAAITLLPNPSGSRD